jgi:hypothetical protein
MTKLSRIWQKRTTASKAVQKEITRALDADEKKYSYGTEIITASVDGRG